MFTILLTPIFTLAPTANAQDLAAEAQAPPTNQPTSAALLHAAATLLEGESSAAQRQDAAAVLAASGDPDALGLLAAATDARAATVQIAALHALVRASGPDAVRLAAAALRSPMYTSEVRVVAAEVLGALKLPEAGEILWTAASEPTYPDEVRAAALGVLEQAYPEILAARGRPATRTSFAGVAAGALGNGLAGGVMLSAVGTWGQNEAAEIIGAVGGGLIGVGTGALYGVTKSTSTGQGFAYASASGWGFSSSMLATRTILGPDLAREGVWYGNSDDANRWQNRAAGVRLAGTLGGAALGYQWMRKSPDPKDVLEVDAAGYLGTQLGYGLATLAAGREYGCEWTYGEGDGADADCDLFVSNTRARSAGALAGTAAGLGGGLWLSRRWDPNVAQAVMGGAIGAEALWATVFLPAALDTDSRDGASRVGSHAGLAGGLAIAHFVEPDLSQAWMTGWGAVLGNALGAGVPLLAGAEDPTVSRVMLPVGLLGTAAGALGAPWVDPQPGDIAMLGVAVPVAVAEGVAVGIISRDQGVLTGSQSTGLTLTISAATGAGLTALAGKVDPQVDDMLFLGSTAVWGVWYGVLTPIALEADLDATGRTLAATITGDAFLLVGGLVLPERTLGLEPRRTVVAQLGGVTGATLGALGASLISAESAGVARGAVLGSAIGMGGGALLSSLTGPRERASSRLGVPELDLPGRWSAFASPTVMEDGSFGLAAQVSAAGF